MDIRYQNDEASKLVQPSQAMYRGRTRGSCYHVKLESPIDAHLVHAQHEHVSTAEVDANVVFK